MVYEQTEQGIVLRVRLAPNSSSCSIRGIFNNVDNKDYLKISVTVVPEKGKANKALIAYLAKQLRVAKGRLEIISGETDHCKKILIKDCGEEVILQLKKWAETGDEI